MILIISYLTISAYSLYFFKYISLVVRSCAYAYEFLKRFYKNFTRWFISISIIVVIIITLGCWHFVPTDTLIWHASIDAIASCCIELSLPFIRLIRIIRLVVSGQPNYIVFVWFVLCVSMCARSCVWFYGNYSVYWWRWQRNDFAKKISMIIWLRRLEAWVRFVFFAIISYSHIIF